MTLLSPPIVPVSKTRLWSGRVISALPVLLLIFSGSMKLVKPPSVVEGMQKFGYPSSLLLILGIVELSCVVIYLIPTTAALGAILLTGYLGGATATHARVLDPGFFMPVLCGVLIWLGLALREPRLWALIPLRR